MRRKISAFFSAIVVATFVTACTTTSPKPVTQESASTATPARAQPSTAPSADSPVAPPADSKLAKIKTGMADTAVRRILGEPASSRSYMTGKRWIPFYYGPDTRRVEYIYSGLGRVVFSRNRYSGSLKVISVSYNADL